MKVGRPSHGDLGRRVGQPSHGDLGGIMRSALDWERQRVAIGRSA